MRDDFIRRRRLKSPQLGIAAGISGGLYAALITLAGYYFPPYAQGMTHLFEDLVPHYSVSPWGALAAFATFFCDLFFLLWLTGTLYNALTQKGYGCRNWKERNRL